MDNPQVLFERRGPVALVTLNRPDARNAYSEGMIDALVATLDAAEEAADVRVAVLTGAGSAFSAGGDVKQMRERAGMFAGNAVELRSRYASGIQRIPRRIARFEKPLLAAVNGPAIGAGLDLACMCDLRLASEAARFGSTFVKLGLIPGDGGAYFLSRTVGLPRALELAMSGRLVDANEALAIGLVHEVVPAEALLGAAMARAEALAALPAAAVRLTKRAVYAAWGQPLEAALELAATYQGIAQSHPDHEAALRALDQPRPRRPG